MLPTIPLTDWLLRGAVTGTISNIKAGGMDVEGSSWAPLVWQANIAGADDDGDGT